MSDTGAFDIGKLLAPRSVALVGASAQRHYSRSIIANLRQHGFADDAIFPVNPRYTEVDGLPCHPSLSALPTVPDVTALLVARERVESALREAADVGSGAALVIADGYAEESAGGLAQQRALGALARAARMAMLGPNTLGYVLPSTGAGLWCAGALPAPLVPGGTVILAQSSGMLNLIMGLAGQRLLGVRACLSVGNAEVLGMPELVEHFVADDEATVLGLVVESVDRPRAFASALVRARDAGKPVVVLKIGVSELGRANSVAHTGRMAGPEQGWTALFDRLGVRTVRDLDDFVETLTLFAGVVPMLPPKTLDGSGLGVAFATISGGETSLICDIAAQEGLPLASLESGTLAGLRAGLGKESMIGNPLDLQNTRTTRPEVFWAGLRGVCADGNVDVLAVRFNLSAQPTPALEQLYQQVAEIAQAEGAALVVLTRAYEHLDLSWWRLFADLGVPFVLSYRNALRGFAALSDWLARRATPTQPPSAIPAVAATGAVPNMSTLDSAATRAWLAEAGVPYVASRTVDDPAAAARAAEELGWPVVLKAVAEGLVHKTEVGGVALDLGDTESVETAAKTMAASVSEALRIPPETVRFEVQRMLGQGVEVIVGSVPDPTWGPLVLVGAGGIHAESSGDAVFDLPPISPRRAGELLRRLRIWPVLDGARNLPRADVAALAQLISRFGDAAATTNGPVDLNPVLVGRDGAGAHAVDAAILAPDSADDADQTDQADDGQE